jgi:hypothetical protein
MESFQPATKSITVATALIQAAVIRIPLAQILLRYNADITVTGLLPDLRLDALTPAVPIAAASMEFVELTVSVMIDATIVIAKVVAALRLKSAAVKPIAVLRILASQFQQSSGW